MPDFCPVAFCKARRAVLGDPSVDALAHGNVVDGTPDCEMLFRAGGGRLPVNRGNKDLWPDRLRFRYVRFPVMSVLAPTPDRGRPALPYYPREPAKRTVERRMTSVI